VAAGTEEKIVVLVAEDETLVRLIVNDILAEAGYRVLEARDGQEALTILQVHSDVAAVVTDVNMPHVDGLSLARIVDERWPRIAIVVASALPLPTELPPGARFVQKPYKPAVLVEELKAALEDVSAQASAAPVALMNPVNLQAGPMHGAGGIAQPLPEPEK